MIIITLLHYYIITLLHYSPLHRYIITLFHYFIDFIDFDLNQWRRKKERKEKPINPRRKEYQAHFLHYFSFQILVISELRVWNWMLCGLSGRGNGVLRFLLFFCSEVANYYTMLKSSLSIYILFSFSCNYRLEYI